MNQPKKIGPGFWASWHIRTLNYTSLRDQELNKMIIERDVKHFPCVECRGHAMEYLAKYPFPSGGDAFSLFRWTIDFHNAVNMRLEKEFISYEDAKKMWSGENICLEDCDEEERIEIEVDDSQDKPDYIYKIY
jgi:hypothetical protein